MISRIEAGQSKNDGFSYIQEHYKTVLRKQRISNKYPLNQNKKTSSTDRRVPEISTKFCAKRFTFMLVYRIIFMRICLIFTKPYNNFM